jgi:hypothetical protein
MPPNHHFQFLLKIKNMKHKSIPFAGVFARFERLSVGILTRRRIPSKCLFTSI